GESPYNLAFGTEVVLLSEVVFSTLRIKHFTPEASEACLKENLDLLEDHRAEAHLKTALPKDSGSTLQSKCLTLNDRHGRPSTQEGQGQQSWTLPWKTRPEMGGSLSHRPSYLR
ncbi:hypothetical protein B296_00034557, partial [Ensete ventricosum]